MASSATATVRPSTTHPHYGYHMTETTSEDEYGFCSGCFTFLLTVISVLLILCTLPFSLCVIMRMVQVLVPIPFRNTRCNLLILGVRTGSHIPVRSGQTWWGHGPGPLLHFALHGSSKDL